MVRNSAVAADGQDVYFTQRFVVEHNGLYFCERDDGVQDQLIGWKYCIPNQGHPLKET
jgi:hypothetical protein